MKNYTRNLQGLCVVIMFGIFSNSNAQSSNWNWTTQTSSTDNEVAMGVAVNPQGNAYHAGTFTGSVMINGTNVQSWGDSVSRAAYISRYTPGGPQANNWTLVVGPNTSWAGPPDIRGLSTDDSGNVYFAYSQFIMSGDTFNIGPNHTYTPPPFTFLSSITFLVKVDPQGNVVWHKVFQFSIPTTPGIENMELVTTAQGDIYITGAFRGGGNLILDTITISRTLNSFVAKATANGDFVWAKSIGSKTGNARNIKMALNDQDELFISGTWDSDSCFVDGLVVVNPSSPAGEDRYIAKLNAAGQAQWLIREGGTGDEKEAALAAKVSGGVLCFSPLDSTKSLVVNEGGTTITGTGMVVIQYDEQGNFQSFAQYPFIPVLDYRVAGVSRYFIEGDGTDFYFGAYTKDAQIILGNDTLANAGGGLGTSDIVLAKIDTMGSVLWAANVGSDEAEELEGLDYSAAQGLTISGSTVSSQLIFGNDTLVNAGFLTSEAFVANLSYSGIGITEYHTRKTINAYPNPTSGVLHFNLEEGQQNSVQIQVQNMLGQTVLNESFNTISGAGSLDVDFLRPGVYLLNIMDGNKLYTGKFIKE
jgi:hypothetical protein